MSYYQVPPQRSYTAGPLPSHSHSHSVPGVFPNSQFNPNHPQPTHATATAPPTQAFPYHQQQPPIARTPSPFRRALPSPQRSDPVPRSLTPGLTSPTAPATASFSASASTFSVNSSGSGAGGFAAAPNVRSHPHSYSMGDPVQNGSPGALPSPYPSNWSPGYQRQLQQPQYQAQQPQPQPQQPYWPSQPPYSQNPPYTPPHPQTAYTTIGGTPPQLPNIRTSAIFPQSQQFTGQPSYYPPQGMSMNGSPTQVSPMRSNGIPMNVRTYSQPLASSPVPPPISQSSSGSSPTRRPLPTPGPQSKPNANPNSVNRDILGGRVQTRSPSPKKTSTPPGPPTTIPPRSQSPVKAIRDIFEARSGSGTQPTLAGLHGKGWSEDSENGNGEARGRSGFAAPGGGRRTSPPKFFGDDDGGGQSVKLISSSTANISNPTAAAYAALPPVPLSSQQGDGTKFVPLWKRGKTFTFNNAAPSSNHTGNSSDATFNGDSNPNSSNQSKPPEGRKSPRPSQPSQPLRYTQPLSQPLSDPRRTRAPPPNRHARSRSQGPPVAHQKPQDAPLLRGAPPGWRTTVSVPEFHLSESPPPVGPGHGRSRSMGPPVSRGQGMSGSGSNSPTKNGRAPDGWKSTAFAARPPPPDVNPRTGEVLPPRHKPPEGWRPTIKPPQQSQSRPPSSSSFATNASNRGEPRQKKEKERPKQDSSMTMMTNRAPEGWRTNVSAKGQQVVQSASQQRGVGAPDGWRSMVPATVMSGRGGQSQVQQPQSRSSYREPKPTVTPTRSRAPPSNLHGSHHGRYPVVEDENVGDSSLEYDSGDAYSGVYDGEEGYSSSMNETAVTGDEETDGASMMSRDTGDTGDTQSSLEDPYTYDEDRLGSKHRKQQQQQPTRSPQYGIRDLPKSRAASNVGFNDYDYAEEEEEDARSMPPPSPGYGIRDLPVRTSFMGSSRSSHRDSGSSNGDVGALPRPPMMSRRGTSQGQMADARSRPQSAVPNISSQRASRVSNYSNNSAGEWPADLPPLPRAPSSTSSGGRSNDSRRLAEQARRRERDLFDLDDAPPQGVSALRRSPSPGPVRRMEDYETGNHRSNTSSRFVPQSPMSREPPPLPPRQTSPSRASTTQSSYGSEYASSRPPSRPEQQSPRLPPRQASPSRPLPQPSQRSRPPTVVRRPSQTRSDFHSEREISTPASYNQPLPASRPYTPVTATPQHKDMPLIEIQSPAPVSGWGRSDLPKIEIDNGGDGDHNHNHNRNDSSSGGPSIMVSSPSSPSISINIVGDDDDNSATGPMISVAGPEDDNHNHNHGADGNNPSSKQTFKRPLPPLHRGGGLICAGCGAAIFGRIVSAMGLRWHPQCFKCTVCDELLEHVSSFEHEGRPYCHLDYHENFAPRCYSCKTAIIEERFISLDDPALGKRTYHEQHFFCAECGDPFLAPSAANRRNSNKGGDMETNLSGDGEFMLDDDVGFTVYKGYPYCEACHVRLRMPKCKKCKRSIRDGMQAVEALGGKWCYDCFVCAGCERPFEDPSFFQRGENPFCERCFSIILRNEI
ncbi:hypothetical protein EYR40_010863 [Pleurotus pulmonarius]|nr:hypothetical protein EYR36_002630 [Pleurotus pulmonarius]KAF4586847.1 hypothetical protein EYR40_010863 [Pleurotus pulmonarius]